MKLNQKNIVKSLIFLFLISSVFEIVNATCGDPINLPCSFSSWCGGWTEGTCNTYQCRRRMDCTEASTNNYQCGADSNCCGNGNCDSFESCSSCPSDCGSCCDYSPACTLGGTSCGNCGTYTGCSTACSGGCTGCTCTGDATATGDACSTGDDCCSGTCVAGTCRTSCTGYAGSMCSSDTNAYNSASGGVCVGSTCDINVVCYDDSSYQTDCSTCYSSGADDDACDSNVGPGYIADGICVSGGSCDIDEVCDSGSAYLSDCSSCGADAVFACDTSVADASFDIVGICVSGGNCDINAVTLDSSIYYGSCDTHGGKQCDLSVADGSYTQNGMCYDETSTYGCSTSGFIYYNGSVYKRSSQIIPDDYTNSSTDFNGKSCDSTITSGGDYSASGMVNSSNLCQPVGSIIKLDSDDNYFKAGCDNSGNPCGTIISDLNSPWDKEGICCSNSCSGSVSSECCDKTQCVDNKLCVDNLCLDSSKITVQNLGTTGLENTNQEYTSFKTVFLNLEFSANALKCRYINYNNPTSPPSNSSRDWSVWQPCVSSLLWELSENSGIKTVYFQVNYSTFLSTSNDSINYNYSGYGLDLTPPSPPFIYHNNFTNHNQIFTISWNNASDLESKVLGIPLIYNVSLFNESNILLANITTTSEEYEFILDSNKKQNHGVYLYANVTVINSAKLYSSALSSDLLIDTLGPDISDLEGYFKNISELSFELMSTWNENTWIYAPQINLSWNSSDTLSPINGYSYILTKNKNSVIDNIPDGYLSDLGNEKTKIYYNLESEKYYFKVKARDKAGNWGSERLINFSVDNSPPSKPRIIGQTQTNNDYTFTWTKSNDPESNVTNYILILTSVGLSINATINDTSNRSFTFYDISISQNYSIIVGALNGAGRWFWSNQEDETIDLVPPVIIAMPNRTVLTNYPVLKAWTNEQAICYYNKSNINQIFAYTNTTYHESKLDFITNGPYTYEITCKDMSDNTASPEIINFTVDSTAMVGEVVLEDDVSYEDLLKTISIQLKNIGDEVSGVNPDLIKLIVEDEEKAVSIFDLGNSYYNISFISPKSGLYNIKVSYNDSNVFDNALLTVYALSFYSSYNDSSLSKLAKTGKRIVFIDDVSRIGIASDANYDLSQLNFDSKINLSSPHKNNIFIFNTKTSDNILSREKFLQGQSLDRLNNPSFGYELKDKGILRFIITSNEFNILSNSDILNPGKYYYLMQLQLNSGKKEVVMNNE